MLHLGVAKRRANLWCQLEEPFRPHTAQRSSAPNAMHTEHVAARNAGAALCLRLRMHLTQRPSSPIFLHDLHFGVGNCCFATIRPLRATVGLTKRTGAAAAGVSPMAVQRLAKCLPPQLKHLPAKCHFARLPRSVSAMYVKSARMSLGISAATRRRSDRSSLPQAPC